MLDPIVEQPQSVVPVAFTMPIEVVESDIDQLGHASNIAYIRWVQEVAMAHSEAVGLGLAGYQRLGAVFVIRRHEVDYLRPVLRGERLELRTWIDSAFAAKCKRATEIVRLTGRERMTERERVTDAPAAKDVVVARAMTTWGFVELASGRPTRIPDEVRVAFGYAPRAPATR